MSLCVIIGGSEDFCAETDIPHGAFIIAADRGYDSCLRHGITPQLLVGDFDSVSARLPKDIETITAPCEKDDTDTMLAVKTAMDRGYDSFILMGVTGGRLGHTAAAVSTLEYICTHDCRGFIDGCNERIYVQGEGRAEYDNCGCEYVSVFSLTDSADVTLHGLKYSGDIKMTRDFPLGVSNEFVSERAEITVHSGRITVILEK